MKKNGLGWWILLTCTLTALAPPPKKIRVWMIGDSTMAHKEARVFPEHGWGMPFVHFFDSTVSVRNHARNGRSTRTFLEQGLWQPVIDSLQEGDYVFIQFGHNDEAKEERYRDRYTPVPDYKANLARFVAEVRAKKGRPVLLTPVTRRRFNKEGEVLETHADYSKAVLELGAEQDVVVIDLDAKSRQLLQRFGPERSKLLFLQLEPNEHPNYPEGRNDNTHFTEFGARLVAQLVLAGIREQQLPLAERVVKGRR